MTGKAGTSGRKHSEGAAAWINQQQSKEMQEANNNLKDLCYSEMLDIVPSSDDKCQSKSKSKNSNFKFEKIIT